LGKKFSPKIKIIFVYQILKPAACQIELGFLENKKPATQKRSGLITKQKQTSLFQNACVFKSI
jgi:hypothetical protein